MFKKVYTYKTDKCSYFLLLFLLQYLADKNLTKKENLAEAVVFKLINGIAIINFLNVFKIITKNAKYKVFYLKFLCCN